jgi:hypothetical protein
MEADGRNKTLENIGNQRGNCRMHVTITIETHTGIQAQ